MSIINCYINNEFPIIATASRSDLTENKSNDPLRYPILHAYLKRREIANERYEFYIDFQYYGEGDTDVLELILNELIKFIESSFDNEFTYCIDNNFYTILNMKGTKLNARDRLIPKI